MSMNERRTELLSTMKNGVVAAMATPLQEDGYRVNVRNLPPLVDLLLEAGVSGLFVGGTTGEGILLDLDQRRLLHEQSVAVADKRAPVLVHIGTNNTADTIGLGRHAARIGADAVVVVTPTFYPMPDEALLAYFNEVARAVPELPLFVYDIPHMAVNGVSPALLQQLAREVPTLAGLKCSRAEAQMIRQLVDAVPHDVPGGGPGRAWRRWRFRRQRAHRAGLPGAGRSGSDQRPVHGRARTVRAADEGLCRR